MKAAPQMGSIASKLDRKDRPAYQEGTWKGRRKILVVIGSDSFGCFDENRLKGPLKLHMPLLT